MSQRTAKPLTITDRGEDEWRQRAACRAQGPDIFFSFDDQDQADALAICGRCTVAQPCLDFARANRTGIGAYGIWGGLTPEERRSKRRAKPVVRRACGWQYCDATFVPERASQRYCCPSHGIAEDSRRARERRLRGA